MTHDLLLPPAIAGTGVSVVYRGEKISRLHRSLCKVLKGAPQARIEAHGRAAAFHFPTRMMAVLLGLELVVDGQAVIRAFRA